MIRRPTELAPDTLEQLGQRVGSARTAKDILKALQDNPEYERVFRV